MYWIGTDEKIVTPFITNKRCLWKRLTSRNQPSKKVIHVMTLFDVDYVCSLRNCETDRPPTTTIDLFRTWVFHQNQTKKRKSGNTFELSIVRQQEVDTWQFFPGHEILVHFQLIILGGSCIILCHPKHQVKPAKIVILENWTSRWHFSSWNQCFVIHRSPNGSCFDVHQLLPNGVATITTTKSSHVGTFTIVNLGRVVTFSTTKVE